jgi:hypothetical protein
MIPSRSEIPVLPLPEIPELPVLVVPVKPRKTNIVEVVLIIITLIVVAFLLLVPPIYIFSAPFLFTEKNYKFEWCCARTSATNQSTEEILFIVSTIFFYVFEFAYACLIFPAVPDSKYASLIFLLKICCINAMHFISLIWLMVKEGGISVYYIVTFIINLIFASIYYFLYNR